MFEHIMRATEQVSLKSKCPMSVNNSCQVKSFGGGIMQSLFKSLSFLDINITRGS